MCSVGIYRFNEVGDLIESKDIVFGVSDVEAWKVFERMKNLARKNRDALVEGTSHEESED
jgi:hypothetical protein